MLRILWLKRLGDRRMLGREVASAWLMDVKPNLETAMRLSPSRRAHEPVALEESLAKTSSQTLLSSCPIPA